MRKNHLSRAGLLIALIAGVWLVPQTIGAEQTAGPGSPSAEAERTAWYRAAKFGMFIHWGAYSVASVEASWPIMEPGTWNISETDYVSLYKVFNPVRYDPKAWVELGACGRAALHGHHHQAS